MRGSKKGGLIPLVGFSWLYLIDTCTLFATLQAVVRLPKLPVEGAAGTPGLRAVLTPGQWRG